MYKILVVDDEADLETLIRQKFRQKIRESRYEFVFAVNGRHALEQLIQHTDVAVVLSDINMPEMDGLTLLSRLNEQHPLLKSVIISAYGDMENIRVAMNRGAFDFITKPVNFADLERTLEKTIGYVAQLHETVRAIRENNILKMYVDKSVLHFMSRQEYESTLLANETVEVSIAFIDICGFTAIAERQPPDAVVRLLNNYFDLIVKEIIAQGGYVDKFMGDAVLAVFREEDHLRHAVRASLAVNRKLRSMEDTFSDGQSFRPQVAIGINSGEVISGNVGSATLRRFDFTVIGDVVNTAQRLQSVAEPGQILLREETFDKVKNAFSGRRIKDATLKNKAGTVTIYEVLES